MDGFVTTVMQILSLVVFFGTIGLATLVGVIWRKQKGY